MMTNKARRENGDEVIRRAVRSCKPVISPSPGSQERALAQLTAHMEARRSARTLKIGRRRHVALFLAGGSAAAALAVVCLAFWFTLGGGVSGARGDFAEVLRRIRNVKRVAHHLTIRMSGQPEEEADILASPGHSRVTWSDGKVQVFDEIQKKLLTLRPALRDAFLSAVPGGGSYTILLQSLRNASDSVGAFAGRAVVDGKEADVYAVSLPEGSMRMWVDPGSELPIRVEFVPHDADSNDVVMVMSDFRWNVPIDESLFLLDVPAGYTLMRLDADPTEADLVRLLRICAEKADGRFPAQLDVPTVFGLIQGRPESDGRTGVDAQEALGYERIQDQHREVLRTCMGGLAFVQAVLERGTWEYLGNDVKLGDGNAVVCWWTFPRFTARRVIYGDLRIADAPLVESPSPKMIQDQSQPAPEEREE